jgi:hypothetical protein
MPAKAAWRTDSVGNGKGRSATERPLHNFNIDGSADYSLVALRQQWLNRRLSVSGSLGDLILTLALGEGRADV